MSAADTRASAVPAAPRTSLRLWVMSDLHMEQVRGWDLPPKESRPDFEVLVMAGDLTTRCERGVRWLLDRVDDRPVIYVNGNHESWGEDIDRTLEKGLRLAEGTNVHLLERRAVEIGSVVFAGATLWTDYELAGDRRRSMRIAGERMNDFKKIRVETYRRRFLPHHALSIHASSRAFLEAEMRRPRGSTKLVVVSHHAPIPLPHHVGLCDAERRPTTEQLLDASYASDLTALMKPEGPLDADGALRPADLWIFGHTHESFDAVVGATRVISNAKGYGPWVFKEPRWENSGFDPSLVVEV